MASQGGIDLNLIYFLRHGENKANLTKEFSCRKVDYSLTPRGVLQAQQTAAFFKTQPIDAIYASPLKRAAETADIVGKALGLPVITLEALREINVGELEGADDLAAAWELHNDLLQSWFDGDVERRFPGGESQVELIARMRGAVSQVLQDRDGKHILFVAHGGIFRLTIEALCPTADLGMVQGVATQNCAYSRLRAGMVNGELQTELLSWGEHGHISGAAADFTPGTPDSEEMKGLNRRPG
jgi:probable phosphoglycerate mutase